MNAPGYSASARRVTQGHSRGRGLIRGHAPPYPGLHSESWRDSPPCPQLLNHIEVVSHMLAQSELLQRYGKRLVKNTQVLLLSKWSINKIVTMFAELRTDFAGSRYRVLTNQEILS